MNVTLGQAVDLFVQMASQEYSKTGVHTRLYLRNQVFRVWPSETCLGSITRQQVQEWVNGMRSGNRPGGTQKPLKAATIAASLSFLRQAFKMAREHLDFDGPDPTLKLRRPKINNRRERVLTEEEEARLRPEVGEEVWLAINFAINTGLRRLEQMRLRQRHIQFFERDGMRLGLATVETSKTGYGRVCPMNPVATAIAEKLIATARNPDGYLFFPQREDRPEAGRLFYKRLIKACAKCEISGLRWHDLRHTAASRALNKGARLQDVKHLLGHSSIVMTERYVHHSTDQLWPAALAACGLSPDALTLSATKTSHGDPPSGSPPSEPESKPSPQTDPLNATLERLVDQQRLMFEQFIQHPPDASRQGSFGRIATLEAEVTSLRRLVGELAMSVHRLTEHICQPAGSLLHPGQSWPGHAGQLVPPAPPSLRLTGTVRSPRGLVEIEEPWMPNC